MDRTLFREEHETFRTAFRTFVEREIAPHQARWREQGQVDRETWRKAGAQGFLVPWLEDSLGGPGGDFVCSVIVMEELARAYESGFAMGLHSDIIAPYIHSFGSDAQKQRWLPGMASGALVSALGMTEPGTGSDLAAVATSAVRDGDDYVLNGRRRSSRTASCATSSWSPPRPIRIPRMRTRASR
ncbi:MAG TPA: acyl-CoA dehydrogenase family protein [Kofleriaceae bacterium]|nr:acyl-CoA dehydrogenase family protein [Kofleriaceae bacterium]